MAKSKNKNFLIIAIAVIVIVGLVLVLRGEIGPGGAVRTKTLAKATIPQTTTQPAASTVSTSYAATVSAPTLQQPTANYRQQMFDTLKLEVMKNTGMTDVQAKTQLQNFLFQAAMNKQTLPVGTHTISFNSNSIISFDQKNAPVKSVTIQNQGANDIFAMIETQTGHTNQRIPPGGMIQYAQNEVVTLLVIAVVGGGLVLSTAIIEVASGSVPSSGVCRLQEGWIYTANRCVGICPPEVGGECKSLNYAPMYPALGPDWGMEPNTCACG